jgi:predicted metal-dependent hydrolase
VWTVKLHVMPRVIRVQHMTRKWGSCSTSGTITLAIDLDDQSAAFQDFVIVHELLHLKVPNHGRLFKALMTLHVPAWRTMNAAKQGARAGAGGWVQQQAPPTDTPSHSSATNSRRRRDGANGNPKEA